jgi:fructose 5-dehydrogenase small subunit
VAVFGAGCSRQSKAPEDTVSSEPPADPRFMRLSALLTGHADLDPLTGVRLAIAFSMLAPNVHSRFPALAQLARSDMSPQDLLAVADQSGLKSVALAIVAAWYTGTAGAGTKAVTVSYRDALMQRPVEDALAPPTYALGGPAWWTAAPPDVGLSRPTARAPAPPTVGNPEPKP